MNNVYNILQQSINNRKDFDASFFSKYNMTEAANNNVATDQYYFDEPANTMYLNNGGSRQTYYRFLYKNMSLGDKIEIEFEMRVIAGQGVRVFVLEGASSTVYTEIIGPDSATAWKKVKKTYFAKSGIDIYVCIGLNSLAGNIALRKVTTSVQRKMGQGTGDKVSSFRKGNIQRVAGGWNLRTEFVHDPVTITETDANTLQITYGTPFTGLVPIPIIDSQSSGMTYVTEARTQSSTLTGFQIKFYDMAGTVVPLANVSVNTYIGFLVIGEKLIFE